jgi:hypothetical protein
MNLPRTLQTLVVATVLSAIESPCLAAAERDAVAVVYHGVSLEVDERLSAGGELLKVVLAGEAFLVSASDAPKQVALRYLLKNELATRLTGAQVQSIALAAMKERDARVLTAAAAVGVVNETAKEFDGREVWQQLAVDAETAQAVWAGVASVIDRAPTRRVCGASAAVGRVLSDEAAQQQIVGPVADRCVVQAVKRALEEVLANRGGAAVIDQLQGESAPFVQRAETLRGSVDTLNKTIAALTQASEQSDISNFEANLEALQERATALGVGREGAPVQHAFIDRAIKQRAFRAAIEEIAQVPFEARSSTTHSHVAVALRELPTLDWTVLLDTRVRPALVRFISKDEEIESQWVETHRRIIRELAISESIESARRLASKVREEGTELAPKILGAAGGTLVQGYLSQGDLSGAEQAVRDFIPQPPLMTRLQLLMARWEGTLAQIGAVGALALLGLLWRRARRRGAGEQGDVESKSAEQKHFSSHQEEVAEQEPQGDAQTASEQSLFSAEYVAALRVFGLQPGATLSQIKNAYRSAVKQYHPDLKSGGSDGDTTLFIRLTSEYEKLLELHERESLERPRS